jgi:hypothetical protein
MSAQQAYGFLHNHANMTLQLQPGERPQRTASGHAELAKRANRLSQRYRTVLLLVDGQRNVDEIRKLAAQAGADVQCLEHLLALGLVTWASTAAADAAVTVAAGGESSLLPSSQSLQGESTWAEPDESVADAVDRPFTEARELLLRAVRQESPVAGALTLMKLRRATSREALEALLDEVEQRLRKPRRQITAAQTMRHVRHLLSLPPASRMPP